MPLPSGNGAPGSPRPTIAYPSSPARARSNRHPLSENGVIKICAGIDLAEFVDVYILTGHSVEIVGQSKYISGIKGFSTHYNEVDVRGRSGLLAGIRAKQDGVLCAVFFQ